MGLPIIPQKVIQRLRLGRSVGVEIEAALPDHRAWVDVEPVLDPKLARMEQREHGLEPVLRSTAGADAIVGFEVRRREIHERFEEQPFDWDLVGLSIDENWTANTLEELEALLLSLGADPRKLVLPHDLEDPF